MRVMLISFATSSMTRYAPVTNQDAPLILVAFQFFASCGLWPMAQRVYFGRTQASTLSGYASSSFRPEGLTSTE